jgi:hypothetical protein
MRTCGASRMITTIFSSSALIPALPGGGRDLRWSRLSEQDLRFDRWSMPGLSCRAEGQRREVSLIVCHAVKARMRASLIVEV